MTHSQWQLLLDVISGNNTGGPVVGFIIDSPWLPGWYGIPTIRYYSSGEDWFAANIKAVHEFPEAIFLPGFWSEFGMCTEPAEVAHRSCSACLVSHIAMKLDRKLYWDPEKEEFRNDDEANVMLSRPQRAPYGTDNI